MVSKWKQESQYPNETAIYYTFISYVLYSAKIWITGPDGSESWEKTEVKKLVMLSL